MDLSIGYAVDKLEQAVKAIRRLSEDTGIKIAAITPWDIQVFSGIASLAKLLDETLQVIARDSEQYPWEGYFTHHGVRYYQIEKTKETLVYEPVYLPTDASR